MPLAGHPEGQVSAPPIARPDDTLGALAPTNNHFAPARAFAAQLQAVLAVQPIDWLLADRPTLAPSGFSALSGLHVW